MRYELVALETLGCKVNQYESSYFLDALREAGSRIVAFDEPADLYIVHSCAVTARAGYQTRQLLRRARRMNPDAAVAVLGCNAKVEAERIAQEQLATHIIGNIEKFDLLQWLDSPATFAHPTRAHGETRTCRSFRQLSVTSMHSGRARAFLKLQDGCDAFCSYCIVPLARGSSRSLPIDAVQAQMERFIARGYREVVLTGIHLGQWGKDLSPPRDLASLISHLDSSAHPCRVRLSSLEPMELTFDLMGQLHAKDWICPHFHVPLQSGDQEILKQMHRPYTPLYYSEVIRELHRLFPEAALGADVLVGFPGETESCFDNTLQLVSSLPLSYLHVFPFSARPETLAARLPGRINGREIKRRTQALHSIAARKKRAFHERFMGRSVEVLAESETEPGLWRGTSANYLKVDFRADPLLPETGALVRVRLTGMTENGLSGELDH